MNNDLIIELPKANALQVFIEPQGVDPYIEKIRKEALSLVPDITTKKGREEIASMAFKVSRSKTYLEKAGKDLCDAERAKIDITLKAVLASRKRIECELDSIRDQVRKPLTDWENEESARKAKIEARIEAMQRLPEIGQSSELIQKHLRRLENTEIDESFGEYTAEAALARTRSIRDCNGRIEAQLKIEADAKEHVELKSKQEMIDKERAAIIDIERLEELRIAEENKLKNDDNHKQLIINEVSASLSEYGFSDCERISYAIADGKVKHVTINF